MTEARLGGPGGRPACKRTARVAEVLRTSRITPHMIRVVLGGDGLPASRSVSSPTTT